MLCFVSVSLFEGLKEGGREGGGLDLDWGLSLAQSTFGSQSWSGGGRVWKEITFTDCGWGMELEHS